MNKPIFIFSISTLTIALFLLLYVAFLLLYPYKTLEVQDARVVTKSVKSGGTLVYSVKYCKKVDFGATVFRQVISTDAGGTVIPYPVVSSVAQKGCHTTLVPLMMIENTPPGKYYLSIDALFKPNPLRDIHILFQTDVFEVVK